VSDAIGPEDLPETIIEGGDISGETPKYYAALKDFKRQLLQQALQQAHGSYQEAANALGLHANFRLRQIRYLDIKSKSWSSASTTH
jgi:transcriptional regulator with GAF, ATPase, and Fis domain